MGTHYANAPIIEAVFDVRVVLPDDIGLDDLAAIVTPQTGYPRRRESIVLEAHVDAQDAHDEPVTSATKTINGWVFISDDELHAVQTRLDGFTFSRLPPYETWEAFSQAALGLWSLYEEVARPLSISRLAVRYINRIPVPGTTVKIEEWLNTYIQIAADLPQELDGFFMQARLPLREHDATVDLTHTVAHAGPPIPDIVPLILDIDVYRDVTIPVSPPMRDLLAEAMEQLRAAKNYVFEACITDRTRELIK